MYGVVTVAPSSGSTMRGVPGGSLYAFTKNSTGSDGGLIHPWHLGQNRPPVALAVSQREFVEYRSSPHPTLGN